jgi:exopolysaccharide biosynthesis protein
LNDTRRARRTFAAVDGNGRAALGVSSTVSLAQLGKILSLPDLGGKMKIVRALNLDGGSSTAFWFGGKDEAYSIREAKSVRDFVAILPR